MNLPNALRILALVSLATAARAQHLLSTYTGSVGDEFGASMRVVSDQNNDGFLDYVVGAPGFNGGRGYIRCLSGQFLKNGTGPAILWTLMPGVVSGARFGSQILEVSSLTGDSTRDLLVSAPGVNGGGSTLITGAIFLVDGATHQIATHIFGFSNTRLGTSIADCGDQNADGKPEIAATAPSTNGSPSLVRVIDGTAWGMSNDIAHVPQFGFNANGSNVFGDVVASGFDLDGDGKKDLAIGSPRMFSGGWITVIRPDLSVTPLGDYMGANAGERMGSSIDWIHDVDNDAVDDLVFGAPNMTIGSSEVGRAVIVSGRKMHLGQLPMEIHDLRFSSSGSFHFGACVRGAGDLNRDGVSDVLVGAPDYFTAFPAGPNKGAVFAVSGRTGGRMAGIGGVSNDHLGDCLQGGFLDINSDGFLDFAVAGSLSDNATTDCGTVKFYSLFPCSWTTYCTPKINSQGCTPAILGNGTASTTPGTLFQVNGFSVLNNVNGLCIYSHAPSTAPFQGGTLCVATPLTRTNVQNSGGSASGVDCTGTFSLDFNARIQSGIDPTLLVVGNEVFCQYWSRDSASPSTTNLTNGLSFVINP